MGSCFAVISPDQLGAYEVLGSFQSILPPGLHMVAPWSTVRKISTRLVENKVITETKTKDNVFVQIHISVQQEVHREKAQAAFYRLSDPRQQIESFVSDVVRSHAPKQTLDELFESKEELAKETKERLSSQMEDYGYSIHQVLVTDIAPDDDVKAAMNQKFAQERLRAATEQKAEADYAVLVKAAEAEAKSKELQGQGIAASRTAVIKGLQEAVATDGKADVLSVKEVTEIMLVTQYLDTLEKLAQGTATTVFVPHSAGGLTEVAQQIRNGMMQASMSSGS
mmetsp:Transcript_97573/g.271457  ORF Transcript_97573/g.271457 Transcript_97573/m.271457 type:complete len:281 (-) Transcript_97573:59-901(-)